jgi:hypothetical protein
VHLPWLDRLFGSHHLPAQDWPQQYGLADGQRGPRGFWRQLLTLRWATAEGTRAGGGAGPGGVPGTAYGDGVAEDGGSTMECSAATLPRGVSAL